MRAMLAGLRCVHREFLGINRRNHDYLFRWNRRDRWALVDDKRETKRVLAQSGLPTPALLAVCEAPWEIAGLRPTLEAAGAFALKPARGAGGSGIVVVVERRGERFVTASGRTLGWRDLTAHAADVLAGVHSMGGRDDALLVEARVAAAPALAAFGWGGVPDLRVVVLRGVPVLAMLRLPTRRSAGRANLHLGGIGVGVALDSGTTTYAVAGRRPVTAHPDTGAALAGVALPAWEETLRLAVRAADAVGLGFLGVDVVVDGRHGPLVLELNARPGLAVQLANRRGLRPLLERVGRAAIPADVEARVALGRSLR